jgi:putative ABC transport system substrate-binding protein
VIQSVALSLRMEVSPLDYAREEGLMATYGPNSVDPLRRAAGYVAKPGDLPVQNPTQYELVINLKTAKTLPTPPATPTA